MFEYFTIDPEILELWKQEEVTPELEKFLEHAMELAEECGFKRVI